MQRHFVGAAHVPAWYSIHGMVVAGPGTPFTGKLADGIAALDTSVTVTVAVPAWLA